MILEARANPAQGKPALGSLQQIEGMQSRDPVRDPHPYTVNNSAPVALALQNLHIAVSELSELLGSLYGRLESVKASPRPHEAQRATGSILAPEPESAIGSEIARIASRVIFETDCLRNQIASLEI